MSTAGGYRDPGTTGGGVCRSLRDPVFTTGPMVPNHPLYKILSTLPPQQMPTTLKRTRSPSPPPTAYGQYVYTTTPLPNYKNPLTSKSEEAARRSGDSRAVLWNKNNQYPPSSFYSTPSGQSVYSYSAPTSQPREPEPEYITLQSIMQDKYYARPSSHVTVHGGAIPIQQPPQGAKTGGITSGYPVRAPQPPPGAFPPPGPPPPGTFVSLSDVPTRLLYTQPGTRYLQRDV